MKWSFSNLVTAVFPTQSRESEIENTVHNCVNTIINNANEYSPTEQMRIAKEVAAKVHNVLENEHLDLMNEIREYERVLGIDD
ncbi:hypothetical protein [Muricauda sp. MAR_2010_75]|uniref:hypothetical protein n=1 Tax=Allomuricauda sp. MAR_2010_75 TaxID=1250232 RepID=UPI000563E7D2|nr:hypothetical protein [Muricauda sp. MAR_2010_75]